MKTRQILKRKPLRIASIVMLVAMVSFIGFNEYALAEDHEVAEEEAAEATGINTEQAATVLLLGIGAGVLTAYQGYRTTKADWDTLKFFDGVIMSVLGSVPLAIAAAATGAQLDMFGYILIFFAALGIGNQITKTRKKTVPSNTE